MQPLDQQIRAAQHRLWLNRWLRLVTLAAVFGALLFAAFIALQRGLEWPVSPLAALIIAVALTLIASVVGLVLRHESRLHAAARLDEAAGLRERISSASFCVDEADPFARAVVQDAEAIGASLRVRRHLRLTTPPSLGWAGCTAALALLAFLLPPGWLKSDAAAEAADQRVETQEAQLQVRKQMEELRKLAEQTPALAELRDELEKPDRPDAAAVRTPAGIRHEAIKKIDRMEDMLKQKRNSAERQGTEGLRKMLRRLNPPKSEESATQKLAKSLQQGDFKAAKEELQQLREKLARLETPEQRAAAEQMVKQLENIAKQLEEISKNKALEQKLAQAGVKEEGLKRMLENLRKEDIDQLRQQLEKQGWTQEQIQQMVQQLQEQQTAGAMAQKLAQAMQAGSMQAGALQTGEAMEGLSQAAEMLGEMEMAEMEMAQMEATLAELRSARGKMGCSSCNGKGCSRCGGGEGERMGQGQGMGKRPGQGQGGIAPEEETDVAFKIEKAKVHTGRGAIIGQTLVEGEQVAGEAAASVSEVMVAAERDASDRINRDRVPRQYHKAIREYFSSNPNAGRPDAPPAEEGGSPGPGDDGSGGPDNATDSGSGPQAAPASSGTPR